MIIGDRKYYLEAVSMNEMLKYELLTGAWDSITLCSAFLTESAVYSLTEMFDSMKNRKTKIIIMVGIKNFFTKPKAIYLLIDYIKNNNKSKFDFFLMLPEDINFHMKCCVFLGQNGSKAFVGSANLTETGLESTGELMVEVVDAHTIDSISNFIDSYFNKSVHWHEYINKYETEYDYSKPTLKDVNNTNFFKKKLVSIKRVKPIKTISTQLAAPTIDILESVSKEVVERIDNIFGGVKELYPEVNKTGWIVFTDQTEEQILELKKNYPIGSCFDRPKKVNTGWEIGTERIIYTVGAIVNTIDDEIVIFTKNGLHYRVIKEIIRVAERLGIKSDDEEHIPTKKQMDEYIEFVLSNREK